ncbi:hypothetical protein PIB30_028479 [Stylosanthes scabra]|uniref:Uncharacterized protein n=1 Tax=Stylosanthes scabra TaxID=79078 RepID=A0ABU6Y9P8_9FABA|nr:hypothetical protein [Stylosanthes scabra]
MALGSSMVLFLLFLAPEKTPSLGENGKMVRLAKRREKEGEDFGYHPLFWSFGDDRSAVIPLNSKSWDN